MPQRCPVVLVQLLVDRVVARPEHCDRLLPRGGITCTGDVRAPGGEELLVLQLHPLPRGVADDAVEAATPARRLIEVAALGHGAAVNAS